MRMCRNAILLATALVPVAFGGTISFTGDLRTTATVLDCGLGCTLGAGNTDGDYAQYAAVVETFNVPVTSAMSALTFSYGGGKNGAGTAIAASGFEPYLSLFDNGGNFLASTFFGTTCPAGAQTNAGSGFCYDVALDGGTLAPANYQISISAFENMSFAENSSAYLLSDGFTGLGNLAPGEDLHYAFDVVLTSAVSTPEPGTAGLVLLAAGVCFLKRPRAELKMKNRWMIIAGGLVLLAVLGKFVAVPAIAQVRAALVRDLDNPARNAVQFQLFGPDGSTNYQVPAGKTLVIEDVAFVTPYSNAGTFGIVTTLKGTELVHYFAPVGYSASAIPTNGSWFGGRTTRLYADAGTQVFVQTNGSVGGYLLDAF